MANRVTLFADIILPLPIPNLFTYRVPLELNENVEVGKRAIIQFGKKKLYSGIIANIHQTPPKDYQAKYLDSILDEAPIVHSSQLKFWEWISEYYICNIGEVMNAALPTGLKLVSKTKIILNESIEIDWKILSDKEHLILEALEINNILELSEVESILDLKSGYSIIKSLLEKNYIVVAEQVQEKYKPKLEKIIQLPKDFGEEQIKKIFEELERAPKQLEAFMMFVHLTNHSSQIGKKKLIREANTNSATIKQLVDKGFLEQTTKEESRIASKNKEEEIDSLTPIQTDSLEKINTLFQEKRTVLFHGVTGSGKTEVYIQLIKEQIDKGNQVLYLLPEIALTTQIISRLRKKFGDKVGVYHSKYNSNERVEVWNEMLKGKESRFQIIIGARSAVFLPFQGLGFVIVDEEHDSSYKQNDPAPRYQGRDSAIYLAGLHDAKVLLGSATPFIETYWNAKEGKFGLVSLTKRFGNVKMPEIVISDLKEATKKKKMKSHFSQFLLDNIQSYLDNKEQIILFQNRRGYNPSWFCETCAWVPQCKNCDISLTYHKYSHLQKCHYCGYTEKPITKCKACGSNSLKMQGFGTEKVEEDLSVYFPKISVKRMDYDTTRNKNGYQNIIDDFEQGMIDVLVGTQMVTKGLDFDNVGIVGVLNADSLLHYPDFRSYERSFQLLTQVAGRAGRKEKQGKVIIQTYSPDHPVIQRVIENDYLGMYDQEIEEREKYGYPPFYRLIQLTIKHRERDRSAEAAEELGKSLKKKLQGRVLGPETPAISRIKNLYINQIIIKYERKISPLKLKEFIRDTVGKFNNQPYYKSVRVVIDVDFY
jgi:primosomal protein N' (replication factor Y) (superfamily II helicase)